MLCLLLLSIEYLSGWGCSVWKVPLLYLKYRVLVCQFDIVNINCSLWGIKSMPALKFYLKFLAMMDSMRATVAQTVSC